MGVEGTEEDGGSMDVMTVEMSVNPAVRKSTYQIEMGANTSKTPNAPSTFGVNLQNLTRTINTPKPNSVNVPKLNNSVNLTRSNNSVNAPKNNTNVNALSNNLKVGGKRRKTRRNRRSSRR